jgi:polyadenylate-binding protein
VEQNYEKKSKLFGFVNFETHEAAEAAVEAMHETEIEGKELYVQPFQEKVERKQVLKERFKESYHERERTNVYIKNFERTIGENRLREEFAPFGVITSIKVSCMEILTRDIYTTFMV